MAQANILESSTALPYRKTAGAEVLPGYRIIEPLGRGGFGEVWLCEAPGGLMKAVKFVAEDDAESNNFSLRQEYEAFQTIKSIRHPFLLTLERVELVNRELVMVMELADQHLQDRFLACRASGMVGIPRQELHGYFIDAAEALDHINVKYGLQHLDVKPANLFLLSGHVKVGDYGLVSRLTVEGGANPLVNRGLTPRYVAPEVLRGQIHARSDQYSLALVYQELLTNSFPYLAKSAQQMMLAHVSAPPDLSGLPSGDQVVVAKALAKNPDDRFQSCLAFVHALMSTHVTDPANDTPAPQRPANSLLTTPRPEQSTDRMNVPPETLPVGWPSTAPGGVLPKSKLVTPKSRTATHVGGSTIPARISEPLPPLRTSVATRLAAPVTQTPAPPRSQANLAEAEEPVSLQVASNDFAIKLPSIRSVVTVSSLMGFDAPPAAVWADQLIDAILVTAAGGGHVPKMPGDIGRRTDGTWVNRFPTTMVSSMARLKFDPIIEAGWFDEIEEPEKNVFVLRQFAQTRGLFGKKANKHAGLELTLHWPTTRGCGEVTLLGTLFGTPEAAFVRDALDVIPKLVTEVRALFLNVEDRRKTPRIPTNLPITLYPVADDGTVMPVLNGRCRDISAGGLSCTTPTQPTSRYCFAAFDRCGLADGMAILLRLLRVQSTGYEHVVSAKFRTDL